MEDLKKGTDGQSARETLVYMDNGQTYVRCVCRLSTSPGSPWYIQYIYKYTYEYIRAHNAQHIADGNRNVGPLAHFLAMFVHLHNVCARQNAI